jgi:hypothetical protein
MLTTDGCAVEYPWVAECLDVPPEVEAAYATRYPQYLNRAIAAQ